MKLYHGSAMAGIQVLEPHLPKHGKPYVYLTDSPDLAVIYAHNPMSPPNAWFSYYFKDGALLYDEYFPGQLEELYRGFGGYVYTCEAEGLAQLDQMPWVYLSEEAVPVSECRFIPDLYEELLALEQAGRLTIHRYEGHDEKKLAGIRRMLLREIETKGLRENPESEYARFLFSHFPDLLPRENKD